MRKKINARLIGIALIAILVTLIGVTSIYYYLFSNQVKSDLRETAELLVDSEVFQKEKIEEIEFSSKEVRITWIDETGTVLYDNWNLASHRNTTRESLSDFTEWTRAAQRPRAERAWALRL